MLELRRWNTPTIYNGWEQITHHDAGRDGFNIEPCLDFMPEMGPMVGSAVTVVIEPSCPDHPRQNPAAWSQYRQYVGGVPGPKIVVVQDQERLLEAARSMDSNECRTMITAASHNCGMSTEQMLDLFDTACQQLSRHAEVRFGRRSEIQ